MTTSSDFELAPLDTLSLDEQMKLFGDSFGKPVDETWYRWKHVEGPWGPSTGVVGIDQEGPAAMLLCLPWRFRSREVYTVSRGVDSGTLPRAQRRGLFFAMVNKWVDDERAAGQPFTFCTANEAAARVHARAGATVLSFSHAIATPFTASFGGARFLAVPIDQAVKNYEPPTDRSQTMISTGWEPESLTWRFDHRSGLNYQAACCSPSRMAPLASSIGWTVVTAPRLWSEPLFGEPRRIKGA